jgi:hypothetical protein
MIAGMSPVLREGRFVFVSLELRAVNAVLKDAAVAVIREQEGVTLILPLDIARDSGLPCDLPMRQITLTVHSALEGVGLTAAFSAELARHNIPSNVIAGYYHDHIFVPAGRARDAMTALGALSDNCLGD